MCYAACTLRQRARFASSIGEEEPRINDYTWCSTPLHVAQYVSALSLASELAARARWFCNGDDRHRIGVAVCAASERSEEEQRSHEPSATRFRFLPNPATLEGTPDETQHRRTCLFRGSVPRRALGCREARQRSCWSCSMSGTQSATSWRTFSPSAFRRATRLQRKSLEWFANAEKLSRDLISSWGEATFRLSMELRGELKTRSCDELPIVTPQRVDHLLLLGRSASCDQTTSPNRSPVLF